MTGRRGSHHRVSPLACIANRPGQDDHTNPKVLVLDYWFQFWWWTDHHAMWLVLEDMDLLALMRLSRQLWQFLLGRP